MLKAKLSTQREKRKQKITQISQRKQQQIVNKTIVTKKPNENSTTRQSYKNRSNRIESKEKQMKKWSKTKTKTEKKKTTQNKITDAFILSNKILFE